MKTNKSHHNHLSIDFAKRVESAHFRTIHDTGASELAMFIWNIVRTELGLERIRKADLPFWDGDKYTMPIDSKLLTNNHP